MPREILQNTEHEHEDNRNLLQGRELKFLNLNDGQDQDADVDYNVRKHSTKEEVTAFDGASKMFYRGIPECSYGVTVECRQEYLG
jgi:hypothetical protein